MLEKLIEIDHRWSDYLKHKIDGPLLKITKVVSHSADSIIWIPLLLICTFFCSEAISSVAMQFLAGALSSALIVTTLKYIFRRSRPIGTWGKMYRLFDPHSFPSGHAARVFAFALLTFNVGPIWLACLVLFWALLVSVSRIVNGVHYLSDILAGSIIGLAIGHIITLLFKSL